MRQKAQKNIQVKSVRNILNFESAETFKEGRDANSQVITIKYVGGTEVLCSCRLGKKKKWCEHRVGMLIKKEIVQVPDAARLNVRLGQKRKRGRPKTKATRARDYERDH